MVGVRRQLFGMAGLAVKRYYRSCSVSTVVRGFPFVAQSCGNCYGLVCTWKSLCRCAPFCVGKKEEIKRTKKFCELV